MNEVTKIHLGRQAFTISVDAHSELKKYLDAISKQVGERDVLNEIELRMAELLSERGINANKVILPGDVDYLKTQLGNPNDFKEDEDEQGSKQASSKRLYRDTDNAMVAGVAAGVAQYFGVEALLIRILFVIVVILTAGWGLLLYIVLWLLVPEAKTSSERLQMAGQPVNARSLKDIVERADVKGTAHRTTATLAGPINTVFRLVIKLIGLFFVVSGLSALFGLITAETYILANHTAWARVNIFPVGFREYLLLDIAVVVAGLIAVIVILFGVAIFRRKWPIKNWVTGILVGLILIGLAVGGAAAGNVYPNVRDRYNQNVHTTVRSLQPFTSVYLSGDQWNVNFVQSSSYSVGLSYYDHPNLSNVKTTVQDKTLTIDTSRFNPRRDCQAICIPTGYNLEVTVYAPDVSQLTNQFNGPLAKPFPPYQP